MDLVSGEAVLWEIRTVSFVVAALGELRLGVGGGDVGVEVGGVVGKSLNLERFAAHDLADQILFDEGEGFDGQGMHLIPEVLAGESGSGEAHEVGEVSGLGPLREGAFAARCAGAGEDGGEDGFADG